jgi:hypothetical protein
MKTIYYMQRRQIKLQMKNKYTNGAVQIVKAQNQYF